MLSFQMDETNFDQTERTGLRIVPGEGLKVDFNEFDADSATIGLWHLHNGGCLGDGTGLEDASGQGFTLANQGATAQEDGYRLVKAENDYLQAVMPSQPACQQLTMECWLRWGLPIDCSSYLLYYKANTGGNWIWLGAGRYSTISDSFISCLHFRDNIIDGYAKWTSAEVASLLDSPAPLHIAGVLNNNTGLLSLYVNGVKRVEVSITKGTIADNYTLTLGDEYALSHTYSLTGTLDEVRLSNTARYSANFTPQRLLPAGICLSQPFDAGRLCSEWLNLVKTESVPSGCATSWDIRCADETDENGYPDSSWITYAGDPSLIPDGCYFQWRASLSSSSDRLTSPTLASAEVTASEAGYNLYHATGALPDALDYSSPWKRVGPTVVQVETDILEPDAIHWFGIRPQDAAGRESPLTQDELRLELDADGRRVGDRPSGVLSLCATPLTGGKVRIRWRYKVGRLGVLPAIFQLFGDGGTGTINHTNPLGSITYRDGDEEYFWEGGPLATGIENQVEVRAVTAEGIRDEQPLVVRVTPDNTPPTTVQSLEAEAVL